MYIPLRKIIARQAGTEAPKRTYNIRTSQTALPGKCHERHERQDGKE